RRVAGQRPAPLTSGGVSGPAPRRPGRDSARRTGPGRRSDVSPWLTPSGRPARIRWKAMATSEFVPQPARYAIFVDAGYLYAASGALLLSCGSRREYRVAAEKLIKALTSHADEQLLGELLRVYWFDAAPKRQPTVDQRVIANLPLVKLRLGNLNAQGQQKGVDAQLRADLEALARHRAITDAVLLAG